MISRLQLAAARGFAGFMVVAMTLFYPAGVYATEQPATETTPPPTMTSTQPPASDTPAPATPTPSASAPAPASQPQPASAPATTAAPQQTSPKPATQKSQAPKQNTSPSSWESSNKSGYIYNPDTGCWETVEFICDPDTGKYVPRLKQQPGSSNSSIVYGDKSSQKVGSSSNAAVANDIYSFADSGDALVDANTVAGDAISGDALAMASLINMLNSSVGVTGGGQIATFSSDIHGDVFGDLYIDPSVLSAVQPASDINGENANLKVNAEIDNKIENNLALDAQSGDATVSRNTQAGGATSGSAHAVANIINMLNAAISTGSSFLGILNIYGSLNGDILLPEGLLDQLLASNGYNGPPSTSLDVNLNDNQKIANSVSASAASGNATVADNTVAGNAVSGNGQTNVTILNLTGRNVVAANSLLVFVNVLGTWVGVIMDAPTGSTSAAIGTGVTENSAYENAEYDVDTNSKIENNIDINARSGDASVIENTEAGDATSGDATASVNLANIINSSFSLADWFGVLFINVFGTWNGSFGVDTAAGERPAQKGGKKNTTAVAGKAKVFQFVPNGQGGTTTASVDVNSEVSQAAVAEAVKAANEKLGTTRHASQQHENEPEQTENTASQTTVHDPDYLLPIVGFAIGGTILGGERVVSYRQRRKSGV